MFPPLYHMRRDRQTGDVTAHYCNRFNAVFILPDPHLNFHGISL
jgi:hypothetical protein